MRTRFDLLSRSLGQRQAVEVAGNIISKTETLEWLFNPFSEPLCQFRICLPQSRAHDDSDLRTGDAVLSAEGDIENTALASLTWVRTRSGRRPSRGAER